MTLVKQSEQFSPALHGSLAIRRQWPDRGGGGVFNFYTIDVEASLVDPLEGD